MSGKPYPEGVQNLSAQFRFLENARQEIARLTGIIDEHRQKLDESRNNERKASEEIHRLMAEMDVHAPGNMGYKDRLMWLLRELNTQAEQYGRTHQ